MSGVLVFVACLAVVVAIAVPTVARASGSPSKPPAVSRVAAVDAFLKLDGLIAFDTQNGSHYKNIKLTDAECKSLVVVAHRGWGVTGPIVARTNAMLGNNPSTCVYSLKIPTDQNVTIGVESFSWGASKLSSQEYLKLTPEDKTSPLAPSVKLADGSWVRNTIKGESSFLKLDYKELKAQSAFNAPPIHIKLGAPVNPRS